MVPFLFMADKKAGILCAAFVAVYIAAAIFIYALRRRRILNGILEYAADYGQIQKKFLKELFLPYAVLDTQGHMLWGNDEFRRIIENVKAAERNINNIFPELTAAVFPKDQMDVEVSIVFKERNYRAVIRKIQAEEFLNDNAIQKAEVVQAPPKLAEDLNTLVVVCLYDETDIVECRRQIQEERMIVALIYIDNYEESLDSVDEVRRSLLAALIDRKINKYMQNMDGIIKKLEKDKYIAIFKQKYLIQMQENRFSLLDEVRSIDIGNDIAITISIGVGIYQESYLRAYEYARAAIDLALGRGGDQAVVKESEKIQYYGGKNVTVEKSTRVKARVKAHALRELIGAKERVVIMGHSIADVDSFGSAIGIYRISKTLGKKAHIVLGDVTSSVRPIMKWFQEDHEYEDDMILDDEEAMELVDNNTLLVVVDVNRPSYTQCPQLLKQTRTIVILDHHRKTEEAVENAVLSYIEPYASSACEMVAEILQYVDEGLRLRTAEAEAMYAGMMIDTNNFFTKTGVRTFEAAAFLRRNGVDITKIRKVFRQDIEEYRIKAAAIQKTEIFMEEFAMSDCEAKSSQSPTVLGAQVANELMDIDRIKASFVFTEYNNKIYISARSIDEVNVQLVMEKLGGGGHASVAGAQLKGCTPGEARERVKEVLVQMIQDKEI
jgi:c-di-AMP phosphodiesterase-like protein